MARRLTPAQLLWWAGGLAALALIVHAEPWTPLLLIAGVVCGMRAIARHASGEHKR